MYLHVKNKQIKMILMNHGKPELSFKSYDELIFRLWALPEH